MCVIADSSHTFLIISVVYTVDECCSEQKRTLAIKVQLITAVKLQLFFFIGVLAFPTCSWLAHLILNHSEHFNQK